MILGIGRLIKSRPRAGHTNHLARPRGRIIGTRTSFHRCRRSPSPSHPSDPHLVVQRIVPMGMAMMTLVRVVQAHTARLYHVVDIYPIVVYDYLDMKIAISFVTSPSTAQWYKLVFKNVARHPYPFGPNSVRHSSWDMIT